MKIICCILFGSLALSAGRPYSSIFKGIDLDEILNKDIVFKNYFECLVYRESCAASVSELKTLPTDALKQICPSCDEHQIENIRKFINSLTDKGSHTLVKVIGLTTHPKSTPDDKFSTIRLLKDKIKELSENKDSAKIPIEDKSDKVNTKSIFKSKDENIYELKNTMTEKSISDENDQQHSFDNDKTTSESSNEETDSDSEESMMSVPEGFVKLIIENISNRKSAANNNANSKIDCELSKDSETSFNEKGVSETIAAKKEIKNETAEDKKVKLEHKKENITISNNTSVLGMQVDDKSVKNDNALFEINDYKTTGEMVEHKIIFDASQDNKTKDVINRKSISEFKTENKDKITHKHVSTLNDNTKNTAEKDLKSTIDLKPKENTTDSLKVSSNDKNVLKMKVESKNKSSEPKKIKKGVIEDIVDDHKLIIIVKSKLDDKANAYHEISVLGDASKNIGEILRSNNISKPEINIENVTKDMSTFKTTVNKETLKDGIDLKMDGKSIVSEEYFNSNNASESNGDAKNNEKLETNSEDKSNSKSIVKYKFEHKQVHKQPFEEKIEPKIIESSPKTVDRTKNYDESTQFHAVDC